ncbi:MAG: hypothetical protein K6F33_11050 [Bacteroidales bacterium]|nr:hypothetical protein [Bacteroidales bacterium]
MSTLEIKNEAMNTLMDINKREFLKQINSILKWFVKNEQHTAKTKAKTNAEEINVSEMSDKDFLDYFCSLPDHNPMTAEEIDGTIDIAPEYLFSEGVAA